VFTGPVDDETVGAHGTIVEGACDALSGGPTERQAYPPTSGGNIALHRSRRRVPRR